MFWKYPDIKSPLEIVSYVVFKDEAPSYQPGRRSRIGGRIYLIDSPQLADKLKNYPEDFKFFLSSGFSITLRGGSRGEASSTNFSNAFAKKVMLNSASEAMQQATAAGHP